MDANLAAQARDVLIKCDYGVLSTQSADCPGFPFGSLVPVGFDAQYRPIVLLSRLAQHTQNLQKNAQVSLLLSSGDVGGFEDIQTRSRITLLAEAQPLQAGRDDIAIERYERFYPQAADYHAKLDFDYFRLQPVKVRFIAGFGQVHWVEPEAVFISSPLAGEAEAHIVNHMNEDHVDALCEYCRQAGLSLPEGVTPEMVGVDAFGFHQRVGARIVRFAFPQPVATTGEVRKILIAMLKGEV